MTRVWPKTVCERERAHCRQPERIFADGLNAYPQAMGWWEGESRPQLVARAGIRPKPHANNNRIERLNGTLRERVKVQRGWKSMKTPLAEGQRIHYNFVKPHKALEGQTPAERAGVGIGGKDKWLELLQRICSEGAGQRLRKAPAPLCRCLCGESARRRRGRSDPNRSRGLIRPLAGSLDREPSLQPFPLLDLLGVDWPPAFLAEESDVLARLRRSDDVCHADQVIQPRV